MHVLYMYLLTTEYRLGTAFVPHLYPPGLAQGRTGLGSASICTPKSAAIFASQPIIAEMPAFFPASAALVVAADRWKQLVFTETPTAYST